MAAPSPPPSTGAVLRKLAVMVLISVVLGNASLLWWVASLVAVAPGLSAVLVNPDGAGLTMVGRGVQLWWALGAFKLAVPVYYTPVDRVLRLSSIAKMLLLVPLMPLWGSLRKTERQ